MTSLPHLPDQIERLATEALIPYARNSRTHSPEQVEAVAASIREFGFTNPVLIDANNTIIAGHGRVMAAQSLGLAAVPCIRLAHLTEAQRRAYVIADNKLAEQAGWNMALLRREVEDLMAESFDVSLLGFADDELRDMLGESLEEGAKADIEAAPGIPSTPTTKAGDVWMLGAHRVICGDSTDVSTLKRLMGGGAG